jgi:ABC-type multidrug transport system ATPase subunit
MATQLPAVNVVSLSRTFQARGKPPVQALHDVSLTVMDGEVHGLLGPNGAGKTTLVKILTTVLLPTGGQAEIFGHDVVRDEKAVRSLVGVVFGGELGLYMRLTARQNLEYWASLYRVPSAQIRQRSEALLERVGLAQKANVRVETFSRGMRQRLHLARGLVAGARVLFLDEPTAGIDPQTRLHLWELLRRLHAEGLTILLTTHYLEEAEGLCERIAVLDHGQVLACGTMAELTASLGVDTIMTVSYDGTPPPALRKLAGQGSIRRVEITGNQARVFARDAEGLLGTVVRAGGPAAPVSDVTTVRPSLESVFITLTGRDYRE